MTKSISLYTLYYWYILSISIWQCYKLEWNLRFFKFIDKVVTHCTWGGPFLFNIWLIKTKSNGDRGLNLTSKNTFPHISEFHSSCIYLFHIGLKVFLRWVGICECYLAIFKIILFQKDSLVYNNVQIFVCHMHGRHKNGLKFANWSGSYEKKMQSKTF